MDRFIQFVLHKRLLIIIVTLFENFFHWIQFFIVCFKIPGLKAKGKD